MCAGFSWPAHTKADLQKSISALLAASEKLAALLERTKGFTEVSMDDLGAAALAEATRDAYPSEVQSALEARRSVLEHGMEAVPIVLAELRGCQLDNYAGASRASFANGVLAELAGGHFGWKDEEFDEEARTVNKRVVTSWSALWEQTKDDPQFWSGLRCSDSAWPRKTWTIEPVNFIDLETVMPPGMKITARTSTGTISISAERGFWRSYEWEGASRAVLLTPQRMKFGGRIGLSCPGSGDHWEEHNGITRAVTGEAQQHFKTVEQALAWIELQRTWLPLAYRSDGLVIGWDKTPGRNQLNVEVWQITIGGKVPTQLPGSQDDAIVVSK